MNYKRNEDIIKVLKAEPILDKILKYKISLSERVERIHRDRLLKSLKFTHTDFQTF
jgi:hypothetical protein